MKVDLSLSRKAPCELSRRFFFDVANRSLAICGIRAVDEADVVSLGAALVDEEEMRALNRTYRGKDRVTDILSFGSFPNKKAVIAEEGKIDLGDLVLSPDFIRRAAEEDQVSLEVEMAFIFSHGIFHLLGFRHSPRMFRLQDEITALYATSKK